MDYNQIKKLVDIKLCYECKSCFVVVEDETALVIDLNPELIYITFIHTKDGVRMCKQSFDSELNKKSEFNHTFLNFNLAIEYIVDIIKSLSKRGNKK
ncbi:hypothetical protein VPHK58G2_0011 [Vibrio phage K58 g2]